MNRIVRVELRRLVLPLLTPYKLSYRTFEEFEPFVAIVGDDTGNEGFGEGHISPGSSSETRAGGWAFMQQHARSLLGLEMSAARERLERVVGDSPVAASSLMAAIEMLERHPLLTDSGALELALLSPVNGMTRQELEVELEARIEDGFRTFKVKVGKDVDADVRRMACIQSVVGERATLRADANRAYSVADAMTFATSINPEGVELFEQPCAAEDWDANAAVAACSRVPLMLDEPICSDADIDRAAAIDGVGYCKVKLKRFGGIDRLHRALLRIVDRGMRPVLGDGLGAEVACWMEACVARDTIDNAGEFNGYLKPAGRLLTEPLGFCRGALVAPAGFAPQLDQNALAAATVETFTAP